MIRFWQRERYALATWEAYKDGRVIFRGNTSVSYLRGDREILLDEMKRGMAEFTTEVVGQTVEPKQVHITGFFPVP